MSTEVDGWPEQDGGREPDADIRPALGEGLAPTEPAAWESWYEPSIDIGKALITSPHDLMREAFRAGWEARGGVL